MLSWYVVRFRAWSILGATQHAWYDNGMTIKHLSRVHPDVTRGAGAGTIIPRDVRVPSGQLWVGNPGKYVRVCAHYVKYLCIYPCTKKFRKKRVARQSLGELERLLKENAREVLED